MKKIITILITTSLLFTLVGCGCNKKEEEKNKEKEEGKLRIELKDNIKATAEITKNVDLDIVRVKFDRKKEGSKVDAKLKYYKDDKKVYEDHIIYMFPAEDTECIMDIQIQNEIIQLKDPTKVIDPKDYNDENTKKEKIEYDYLKLEIQNSK